MFVKLNLTDSASSIVSYEARLSSTASRHRHLLFPILQDRFISKPQQNVGSCRPLAALQPLRQLQMPHFSPWSLVVAQVFDLSKAAARPQIAPTRFGQMDGLTEACLESHSIKLVKTGRVILLMVARMEACSAFGVAKSHTLASKLTGLNTSPSVWLMQMLPERACLRLHRLSAHLSTHHLYRFLPRHALPWTLHSLLHQSSHPIHGPPLLLSPRLNPMSQPPFLLPPSPRLLLHCLPRQLMTPPPERPLLQLSRVFLIDFLASLSPEPHLTASKSSNCLLMISRFWKKSRARKAGLKPEPRLTSSRVGCLPWAERATSLYKALLYPSPLRHHHRVHPLLS